MYRLGHKDPWVVFIKLQPQRRGIRHHIDKLLIAYPRGVKQNVIAEMPDFIHHLTGVVNSAVIGTQLNDRQAERTRRIGAFRHHVTNLVAQVRFIKTVRINTTDKTKRVTRRFKIDRRRPGLNQGAVVVGFVIITIKQHQIAARQQGVGDHFIRRRSSIQHKIGFIRIKHFCRKFLRVFGRTFMY